MRILFLWPFTLFILVLMTSGCIRSEIEDIEIDSGYDYSPLQVGKYFVYQVDSTEFRPVVGGIALDSSSTFVKELIADSFPDNTGAVTYRLERYERKDNAQPWTIRSVYALTRTEEEFYRTEDNLRFVKLRFPLQEGRKWNPTRFFDNLLEVEVAGQTIQMFKSWSAEVSAAGRMEEIGNLNFPDVATIVSSDSENLIEKRYAMEKYARNIGLVFRELQIMDTQCNGQPADCATLPWPEKAERGFIVRQWLVEHNW